MAEGSLCEVPHLGAHVVPAVFADGSEHARVGVGPQGFSVPASCARYSAALIGRAANESDHPCWTSGTCTPPAALLRSARCAESALVSGNRSCIPTDVRGHEKVPAGGQVEVPAGGLLKIPAIRSSCRAGARALRGDGGGV